MLKRTPFYNDHVACGARLIDFGGWEMPVQYSKMIEEHKAVRSSVGLFDVSHMGELRVRGPQACKAIDHLVSNDISKLTVGNSMYAALMNESGGIVDDLFIYRLADEDYLVCVNAANTEKDWAWFQAHNPFGADMENQSAAWAQIALQGRNAVELAQGLTSASVRGAGRGSITPGDFAGAHSCLLARTGYTGEDGFEVFIPADQAEGVWAHVMAAGAAIGIKPCGLGARDTLRLEVRNVLYGNDIDDTTSPLEAGLNWITKPEKGDFVGREALLARPIARRLVGIVVDSEIPRAHCPILNEAGETVGEVTSGTRSPSTGQNIALGYVKAEGGNARPGNRLKVDVRGRVSGATVVKGPFYNRDY